MLYIDQSTNIPYRWDSATDSYIAIGSQGGSTVTIQSSSTTKPTNPKEGDVLIVEVGGKTKEFWIFDDPDWKQIELGENRIEALEEFTATASQVTFTLANTPIGAVKMTRNGVLLPIGAYSVSGVTVTYTPSGNNNNDLLAGDRIEFFYENLE